MFPLLQSLKSLHDLDQEILAAQAAIDAARRDLETGEAELARAQEALEALRARDQSARAGAGLKEMELKGLEGQVTTWTVKLNTTRDNKEYQAILHQIATIKEQKGKMEEEILALLDAGEGVSADLKAEEKHLLESRKAFESRKRQLEEVVASRQREGDVLAARREQASATLPGDTLTRYDRIRNGRKGAGLASVEGDVCQGCYLGLTPNQANQLQQDRVLVLCQGCGRILHPAS